MESKLLLKSKTEFFIKLSPLLIIPFGVFMLYLSQSLFSEALTQVYPQLTNVIFGIITATLGFFSLKMIFTGEWTILIHEDKIILKSLFGNIIKLIPKKDIISWSEIKRKDKNSEWLELVYFTKNKKYSFDSKNYQNYDQLKEKITRDIPKDVVEVKETKWWKIIPIALLGLFSFFSFNSVYEYYQLVNNPFNESDLIIIRDELINEPKIIKGSKGRRSIDIKIKSSPEFTFDISGESYYAMRSRDFVKESKIGDSISMKISKEDYNKKIIKKMPLTFLDKSTGYSSIKIYGVKLKDKNYLNLSDYYLALKDNKTLYWFIGILGCISLFLFIIGVVDFDKIGKEYISNNEDES